MPSITTNTQDKDYTVQGSRGAVANLSLPITTSVPREFTVVYPANASGLQVRLVRGTAFLDLLPNAAAPGGMTDSTTFANRMIDASTAAVTGGTELWCGITALASAATEPWQVRVTGTAAVDYRVTTTGSVTRIMCDPVVGLTVSPTTGFAPGHTVEGATVKLTAADHAPAGQPTFVGVPIPSITYRFSASGPIAIPGLPACINPQPAQPSPAPVSSVSFVAPPVAGDQTVNLVQEAWYEGTCAAPGLPIASSPPQPFVIEPRPTVTPNVHSTVGFDTWVRE
jgi:hypothetical protein